MMEPTMSDTTCVYPACMGHTIPGCQGPCKKPFVGHIPRQDTQFPPPDLKPLRYFFAQGNTLDEMRDHARQHTLAREGDMKLVWVNEGDLYNHLLKGKYYE